jgi:sec-independent protein translocase protein TatA
LEQHRADANLLTRGEPHLPIGWPELVIIAVILLMVFGPARLPRLGEAVGESLRAIRRASDDERDVLNDGERR